MSHRNYERSTDVMRLKLSGWNKCKSGLGDKAGFDLQVLYRSYDIRCLSDPGKTGKAEDR